MPPSLPHSPTSRQLSWAQTAQRAGLSACLLAALTLPGCAPGTTPGAVATVPVPTDDGSACYQPARLPFYQAANAAFISDQQVQNANNTNKAIAVAGGIATIAGLIAGGRVGYGIAAAGAVIGVAAALSSNIQTDQRLIADVSVRFQGLAQCRQDEAAQVRAEVRARRLTREAGQQRLTEIRNLLLTDADIARRVNYMLAQRNQTYSVEANDVDTQIAREPDPVKRQQKMTELAQARQTIQSNQRALTDQVQAINKAADTITVSSIEAPSGRVRHA